MNRCRTKDYNDFSYELNSLKKEIEKNNIKHEKNKNKSYEMRL